MSNEDVVRSIYQSFSNGDLQSAADSADDSTEVTLVPMGASFAGREGFIGFMSTFKNAFPDLRVNVENLVASSDSVVAECSWSGTHSGDLATPGGPIAATGKRVDGAQFVEVYEFRNGKVWRMRNYQDLQSWLRQLGVG